MRADLPGGTVTFLFTDIEGSTRLLHALGPDDYADALSQHRRTFRHSFAAHDGVEVDTQGDAFFAAFPTADGAADAALEARAALAGSPISVRMGLHTGSPKLTPEGYVGVDVHRGARVAALAHGGQIVLSPTSAALLEGRPLADLGLHRLRDFEGATRLYQLGEGVFAPLRTPGSVELPVPATRFLGRERELFDAVSLVYERDPRVLTVLGPGGTGKTRFALELTRLLADEADGGSMFVGLAPLRDPELVLPAIGDRLGAGSDDPDAIAARISGKRTHLLLDSLEHLLPEAARPLAELAAAAPALRMLTTSREPLRIQGEVELDLPPLAEDEAVTFFCERAQAVRPDVQADSAVSELCTRLDCLPLALELAAARTKLLSPAALLARLSESLDLLKGARDVDERHATLHATIAWSHDLLDEDEQLLFRRLSVFRGGCTLDSAEAVCDADLDVLASLLDKSLVRRRAGRLGEERYWMLETIRAFAREQLDVCREAETIRRHHADRMLGIALSAHLTEDDDEQFRLPLVLSEEQDMRAALDWASESDVELALRLVVALENFWNVHSHLEALRRLDRLLPFVETVPLELRAAALRVRGGALHVDGDFDSCDEPYEESLALYRQLGSERGVASLLQRLANSAFQRDELQRSRALIEESQALAHGRFPYVEIANTSLLGRVHVRLGDVEAGAELLRQSADMAAEANWHWWRAGALASLAMLELERGDLDLAQLDSQEALRLIRPDESRWGALTPLTVIARVALSRDDRRRAGVLWGAVEAETERSPSRVWQRSLSERAGPLLDESAPDFLARGYGGSTARLLGRRRDCARRDGGASDRAVEGEHDADEELRVLVQPDLAHGAGALVPAGEREADVPAELVELPAQVADPCADVAPVVARRAPPDQHRVHELPRLGQELHDADRTHARHDVLLEAGLHPRERSGERGIDAVEPRPVVDGRPNRFAGRGPGSRRQRSRAPGKRQSLSRDDDACERHAVSPGEEPGADVVARGDREEALAGTDGVETHGRPSGQRSVGVSSDDPVGNEPLPSLEAPDCRRRPCREPPVHCAEGEPAPSEPELEHGDVPAERADGQRAPAEERPATLAECAPRRRAELAVRHEPSRPLETHESVSGQLPADAVDRPGVEPVGAQRDLERGDTRAARERLGCQSEDAQGQRDADGGEAAHPTFLRRSRPPSSRLAAAGARVQSGRCLPR